MNENRPATAVTPKVSVVMLAYNIGRYVETAIRGVLSQQTDYPVQLVIAEDCSTDDTRAICLRYKERYPDRITLLLHEQNMGLQRNFMDAHRHCTGEYIAICDGDDYWFDRRKLQRMTDFMDANPRYALCFHRVINFYEGDVSKSAVDIYQWFIISRSGADFLMRRTEEIVYYSLSLEMYVWAIDDFGTPWEAVRRIFLDFDEAKPGLDGRMEGM